MFPRSVRAISLAATALLAMSLAGPAQARPSGGPVLPKAASGDHPRTEITPAYGTVMPMKNLSRIVIDEWGYKYISGQQNSRLTITEDNGGLLYVDTGTAKWRDLPSTCEKRKVKQGISAWCAIPDKFAGQTMFLEVWPRLGSDWIDGSGLSKTFRLWVLADKGRDRVWGGAGDDFTNGAQGLDHIWGGGGDDWLRGGLADDVVYGDDGADYLLGMDDSDEIDGGTGPDSIYCGPGADTAISDSSDTVRLCEHFG